MRTDTELKALANTMSRRNKDGRIRERLYIPNDPPTEVEYRRMMELADPEERAFLEERYHRHELNELWQFHREHVYKKIAEIETEREQFKEEGRTWSPEKSAVPYTYAHRPAQTKWARKHGRQLTAQDIRNRMRRKSKGTLSPSASAYAIRDRLKKLLKGES